MPHLPSGIPVPGPIPRASVRHFPYMYIRAVSSYQDEPVLGGVVSQYLNVWYPGDDAALLDPLDEGVASSVVGDGQAQSLLRLHDLDLFGLACRWLGPRSFGSSWKRDNSIIGLLVAVTD